MGTCRADHLRTRRTFRARSLGVSWMGCIQVRVTSPHSNTLHAPERSAMTRWPNGVFFYLILHVALTPEAI